MSASTPERGVTRRSRSSRTEAELALFNAASDDDRGVGLRHAAFRVDRENFDVAQEQPRARRIALEFQAHDVSRSIHFEDPDGLRLELTTHET